MTAVISIVTTAWLVYLGVWLESKWALTGLFMFAAFQSELYDWLVWREFKARDRK